jgi:GT2 family glycosyltransferase
MENHPGATPYSAVRYSVQIVAWNNGPQLVDCLRSVLASPHPSYEVLVLDNASPQDELAAVRENFSGDMRVQCEKSDRNLFFAGGHNHISLQARGEFLILLNPDTVVEPDWLERLDELDQEKRIEIGQLELLRIEPAGEPQTQGIFLDRAGFVKQVMAVDPARIRKDILGANGAALVIRAALWRTLGGFDESFDMYFEETDLCWRAARQGASAEFLPGPVVRHIEGGSHGRTKKGFARSQFLFARNRIWSLVKNLESSELLWLLPLHLLLCPVVALRFVFTDGWGKGWAMLAAPFASVSGWRRAFKSRRRASCGNRDLLRAGLIRKEILGVPLP